MALASVLVATMLLGTVDGMSTQEAGRSVPLVRLKPADAEMRRLISDGFDRSATFRALVDAIHRTNGVVIVQYRPLRQRPLSIVRHQRRRRRGRRSVRIKVNTRTTNDRLIATIAHELQHALEILSDPDVASAEEVLALYRRIGTGRCRQGLSDACETDEALRVEAVVNDELARRTRQ